MLFTSHNQEVHRRWFDMVVSVCGFRKNTQLVFRAFLYEYENRVRIMGDDRGYWFNSVAQIAKDIRAEYITVRTILDAMKSASLITIKSANGVSKIRLCDFEKLYGITKEKSASDSASDSTTESASNPQQNRIEELKDSHELYPVVVPAREDELTRGDGVGMISEEEKQNLKLRFGIPDPVAEPEPEDEPPSPFDTPPDTPPQECYDLIRQFCATLGIPLTPRPYEASQLEAERRKGKLTDDQMRTAVIEGASWISENCRMRPWPGIMGVIRNFDPHKKPGKKFVQPPTYNPSIEQDKRDRCPKCKKRTFACDCGYIRH